MVDETELTLDVDDYYFDGEEKTQTNVPHYLSTTGSSWFHIYEKQG
jgi:hypothetical protein